jgi:hypothetical protein
VRPSRSGILALLALVLPLLADAAPSRAAAAAAVQAAAADSTAAPADSTAAAADSLAAEGTGGGGLSGLVSQAQQGAAQGQQGTAAAPDTLDLPLITSWIWRPSASLQAQVRKVNYTADLESNIKFRDGSTFNQGGSISTEDYRKQDKTVERRDGSVVFNGGRSLPVETTLNMLQNWSEDVTVSTTGRENLNKRDYKQASLTMRKRGIAFGGARHLLSLDGSVNDQKASNQNIRNDFAEGKLVGAWRSFFSPAGGLAVSTVARGEKVDGERSLGQLVQSSSATNDSLGAEVRYDRSAATGRISVRQANFEKRYLDYNRDINGLVDTINTERKIRQELETQDAISVEWRNNLELGPLALRSLLARDTENQKYAASGVGEKERYQEQVDLSLAWHYTDLDSISVAFGYLWKWDDQTYQGATEARGKQYTRQRNLELKATRRLFSNTSATLRTSFGLMQDIAENSFNQNDRDRLETDSSLKMTTNWLGTFRTDMVFTYRQIEDISIKSVRSGNNNIKDSYELAPGFTWTVAPWLQLQQQYLISIQYTDYVFSYLEGVSREDDYNKRGNLQTSVTVDPSERLKVTVTHEYSSKFNATRASTDAAGTDYYARDLEQRISQIDLELSYKAADWLSLSGASYRAKDVTDRFGSRAGTDDKRSGEIWLGATVSRSIELGAQEPLKISAKLRRYHAYGPNVQDTNARYWDADVSVSWAF